MLSYSKIVCEPRNAKEVEIGRNPSQTSTDADNSSFAVPVSPGLAETNPLSVTRRAASAWFESGHAPNVFDSPSVRGCATSSTNSQRRASPFFGDSEPRKRRRTDSDDANEESGDTSSGVPEKCLRVMSLVSEDLQPSAAPLLGQLLSDSTDAQSTGNDNSTEDGTSAATESTVKEDDNNTASETG